MIDPASTTTPQQTLDEVLQRVATISTEIKALGAKIEIPDGPAERTLAELLRKRDEELLSVGRLVFAWTLTGGEVALQETAPPAEAPPPPAPTAATVTRLPKPAPLCEIVPEPARPRPVLAPPPPPSPPPRLVTPVLPDQDEHVRKILGALPPPSTPTTVEAFDEVVRRLVAALGDTAAWVPLTSDVQQMLVGYSACFARHLQGIEPTLRSFPADEVQQAFPPLSSFSRTYRPGFVKGLMRDHAPQLGSWLADAQQWWSNLDGVAAPAEPVASPGKATALLIEAAESGDESATLRALYAAIEAGVKPASNTRLVRALARYPGMLQADPSFKSLRKAIRDQMDADAAGNQDSPAPDEDTDEGVAPDLWPHRHINAGKRAIIVGGSRRPEVADRIRGAFGFAEVEWIDFEPRRTAALAEQIRAGTVDTLFLLSRFINHGHQDILSPACREAKATFVLVSRGYGLAAVRAALEKAHGLS